MRRLVIVCLAIASISLAGCSLIVPDESGFTPDLDTGAFPFDAAVPPPPGDASVPLDASAPDAAR